MKNLNKEQFMEKASQFYDTLKSELDDNQQDFYEYEEKLDDLIRQFGHDVLETGFGEIPNDVRKKKNRNPIRTNRNTCDAPI